MVPSIGVVDYSSDSSSENSPPPSPYADPDLSPPKLKKIKTRFINNFFAHIIVPYTSTEFLENFLIS